MKRIAANENLGAAFSRGRLFLFEEPLNAFALKDEEKLKIVKLLRTPSDDPHLF